MCRNHGCNTAQCVLCKHNPNKRCGVNFAGKYWVGDALLAKCEAEIDVEVLDEATQTRVDASELPAFGLEVSAGSLGLSDEGSEHRLRVVECMTSDLQWAACMQAPA